MEKNTIPSQRELVQNLGSDELLPSERNSKEKLVGANLRAEAKKYADSDPRIRRILDGGVMVKNERTGEDELRRGGFGVSDERENAERDEALRAYIEEAKANEVGPDAIDQRDEAWEQYQRDAQAEEAEANADDGRSEGGEKKNDAGQDVPEIDLQRFGKKGEDNEVVWDAEVEERMRREWAGLSVDEKMKMFNDMESQEEPLRTWLRVYRTARVKDIWAGMPNAEKLRYLKGGDLADEDTWFARMVRMGRVGREKIEPEVEPVPEKKKWWRRTKFGKQVMGWVLLASTVGATALGLVTWDRHREDGEGDPVPVPPEVVAGETLGVGAKQTVMEEEAPNEDVPDAGGEVALVEDLEDGEQKDKLDPTGYIGENGKYASVVNGVEVPTPNKPSPRAYDLSFAERVAPGYEIDKMSMESLIEAGYTVKDAMEIYRHGPDRVGDDGSFYMPASLAELADQASLEQRAEFGITKEHIRGDKATRKERIALEDMIESWDTEARQKFGGYIWQRLGMPEMKFKSGDYWTAWIDGTFEGGKLVGTRLQHSTRHGRRLILEFTNVETGQKVRIAVSCGGQRLYFFMKEPTGTGAPDDPILIHNRGGDPVEITYTPPPSGGGPSEETPPPVVVPPGLAPKNEALTDENVKENNAVDGQQKVLTDEDANRVAEATAAAAKAAADAERAAGRAGTQGGGDGLPSGIQANEKDGQGVNKELISDAEAAQRAAAAEQAAAEQQGES